MALSNTKSTKLRVSIDGPWAQTISCFPLVSPKKSRAEFCKKLDLYVADTPMGERVVALHTWTTIRGERQVYMDVVTGTLYRKEDGKCLSSDYLFVRDIRRSDSSVKDLINNRRPSYKDYQF